MQAVAIGACAQACAGRWPRQGPPHEPAHRRPHRRRGSSASTGGWRPASPTPMCTIGRRDRAPDRGLLLLDDRTTTGSSRRTATCRSAGRPCRSSTATSSSRPSTRTPGGSPTCGTWGSSGSTTCGNDLEAMLRDGRRMIALLGVATGALVFFWARRLYGDKAALLAVGALRVLPDHARERRPDHERHDGDLHVPRGRHRVLGHGPPPERRCASLVFGLVLGLLCVAKFSAPLIAPDVRHPLRSSASPEGDTLEAGWPLRRPIVGPPEGRRSRSSAPRSPPARSRSASSGPRTGSSTRCSGTSSPTACARSSAGTSSRTRAARSSRSCASPGPTSSCRSPTSTASPTPTASRAIGSRS